MSARILVAGVGNIFFGDDAFGVEVLAALKRGSFPEAVKVEDFGIRGMHLAYEIASGYDVVILVDAIAPRGGVPGMVHVMEPELAAESGRQPDAHSMDLENVFAFVRRLGGSAAAFYLVGCEPEQTGEGIGVSPAVAAAVPVAAKMVEDLIAKHVYREVPA